MEAWEYWSHEWCKVDVEVVEPIWPSTIWPGSNTPTLADSQDYSAWLKLNLLWSVWHLCRSMPTPTLASTWCQSRDDCSRTFSTLPLLCIVFIANWRIKGGVGLGPRLHPTVCRKAGKLNHQNVITTWCSMNSKLVQWQASDLVLFVFVLFWFCCPWG